jgi:hypothetical protein
MISCKCQAHRAATPNQLTRWPFQLALALLLVVKFATPALADDPAPPMGTPYLLPPGMKADFGGKGYGALFGFGDSSGGKASVYVRFSVAEAGGKLHFKTIFSGPTSYGKSRKDAFTTSFQPTAICQRSGESDTLYVAGWFPRQRMAVVEEWTLQTVAIGEAISTGGGGPHPTLSAYHFNKRLLIAQTGASARPIEGLACDPFADELIVLEYGPQAQLSRIDLSLPTEDMTLLPLANAVTHPQLAQVKSMRIGFHTDHGLVIVLRSGRAWHDSPIDPVTAFYDVTSDGWVDYDAVQVASAEAWRVAFPSSGWQDLWKP